MGIMRDTHIPFLTPPLPGAYSVSFEHVYITENNTLAHTDLELTNPTTEPLHFLTRATESQIGDIVMLQRDLDCLDAKKWLEQVESSNSRGLREVAKQVKSQLGNKAKKKELAGIFFTTFFFVQIHFVFVWWCVHSEIGIDWQSQQRRITANASNSACIHSTMQQ